MKGMIAWFTNNHVAANLLMVVIVVAGLITSSRVKQEVFPEMDLHMITVTVPYPGATPAEVETSICQRVEERIEGLEGIDRVTSTAAEGAGIVSIELESSADMQEMLDEVKAEIDAIDTFPEEAEQPIVSESEVTQGVLVVAVDGDAPERTLKELGDRLRDELTALDDISLVELTMARPYEVSVEVSEKRLRELGITFAQVEAAVQRSSLDLPAGTIESDGGNIRIRTVGQRYHGYEFERIPVVTRRDGTRLLLGEVATVIDGFEDTDQTAHFNGSPAVMLEVYRVGDQDALEVADAVKAWITGAQTRVPDGISLTIWQDQSRVLRGRLDTLVVNGASGLLLVLVILALFLQLKLAFWVAIGILISFLGAVMVMPLTGVSVNLISLFAFILVLGILVDDAIVVGESIFTHSRRHGPGVESASSGAHEVGVPVVFAVLTTVVAFLPAMFVPGPWGAVWAVIPLVVIAALVFSLIESLLILPAHLANVAEPKRGGRLSPIGWWNRFQGSLANGLETFIEKVYRPVANLCMRWRYVTLAWGIATLVIAVSFVSAGFVQFVFFPSIEADDIIANLEMPDGTPIEVTRDAVDRMQKAAHDLKRELRERYGTEQITNVLVMTGQGQQRDRMESDAVGSHYGAVHVELAPAENRELSATELADIWRDRIGEIAGAEELNFSASLARTDDPINVQLSGRDVDELREVAELVKARLAEFDGVVDISDSLEQGMREVNLRLTEEGELLGLTLADLAGQVRAGFYGAEAQRVQRGREEVRVMIRYPEAERQSLGYLENMRIRVGGTEVPFETVAQMTIGQGPTSITRVDGQRAINVTADIDETSGANANAILAQLTAAPAPGPEQSEGNGYGEGVSGKPLAALLAGHPGVKWSLEGEQRQQRETMEALSVGFLLAMIGIYALLAIPLKSYLQPILIMVAIPFGIIGAIVGHFVMGLEITVLSMIGIVALAGVVVNDSLVLIHFINKHRYDEGKGRLESVVQAGMKRFRPILLTSLTTFAGLTPIMFETSLQAQFLIPMAVSLAWGVVFSTVITLIMIPAAYLALEDVTTMLRGRWQWVVFIFTGVHVRGEIPAFREEMSRSAGPPAGSKKAAAASYSSEGNGSSGNGSRRLEPAPAPSSNPGQ